MQLPQAFRGYSLAAICGISILPAACSGERSEATAEATQSATSPMPATFSMSALEPGKMPGVLTGTIGGNALSLDGICSMDRDIFEFWSDGRSFAVNSDSNGDGVYLNIMIRKAGSKTMAALRFAKDGETIYNGVFDPASFDGAMLSVDSTLGIEGKVPANFEVRCQH